MSKSHEHAMTHEEMVTIAKQDLKTGVGKSVKHDSAAKQVTGEADPPWSFCQIEP